MLKNLEIENEKIEKLQSDDIFWLVGSKYGRNNNHTFIFLSEKGEFRYHTLRDYYPFFVVTGKDVTEVQHTIEFEKMGRYVHNVYPKVMKNPITRQDEKVVVVETTAPYYVTNSDPSKSVSYIFDKENRHNNHVPYHHVVMNRHYEKTGKPLIMGLPYKFENGSPTYYREGIEDNYPFYSEVLESMSETEKEIAYDMIELLHAKLPDFSKMIMASDIEIQVNEGESMDAEKAEVPITSISVTTFVETRVFTLDSVALDVEDADEKFNDGTYEVEYFGSEKKLLSRFDEYINKEFGDIFFRLLVWYNGDQFDIPYIANRRDYHQLPETVVSYKKDSKYWYKKWDNKILLDLYAYFDNNNIEAGAYKKSYENLKLNTVSEAILDRGKYEYNGDIRDLSPQELAFYNAKDTQLTYDLATHDDDFPTFILFFIMRFGNLSLENANRRGVTKWWGGFLFRFLHRRNYYYPNDGQLFRTNRKISGGEVLNARAGVYRDVYVIDFSSLYPTLMINKNICYSTMNCEHEECREKTEKTLPKTGTSHVCQERRGILSMALNFIREARVKIFKPKGKEGDQYFSRLAQFIKIFMNACVERNTLVWAKQPRDNTPLLVEIGDVEEGWYIQDGKEFTQVIAKNIVDSSVGYEIKTAIDDLVVTPEHHMITPNGLVEAQNIDRGDYVRIRRYTPFVESAQVSIDEFLPLHDYLFYIEKDVLRKMDSDGAISTDSLRTFVKLTDEGKYGMTKNGIYFDPTVLSSEERKDIINMSGMTISTSMVRNGKKIPHAYKYPTKVDVDEHLSFILGLILGGAVNIKTGDRSYVSIPKRNLDEDNWIEVVDHCAALSYLTIDLDKSYNSTSINVSNNFFFYLTRYLTSSNNRVPLLTSYYNPAYAQKGIQMAGKALFGEYVELDPVVHPFLRGQDKFGKIILRDFDGSYLEQTDPNPTGYIKVDEVNKKEPMPNNAFIALSTESGTFTVMNGHHTNNCYGALKNAGFAFAHAQAAEYVTTSGREAVLQLKEYIEEGAEVIYGDSVRGKEAVFVRIDNSSPLLMSIENVWEIVTDRFKKEKTHGKTRVPVRDIEIWDGNEWNYVISMIKHFSTKSLYRVSSGIGTVDVTEDHSLIDKDGNKFRPEEVIDGKQPQNGLFNISEREVMAEDQVMFTKLMFLFSMCGTATKTSSGYPSQRTVALNFHERVSNKGIEILTSLQPIIDDFGAKYKTYITKRGSTRVRFSSHQDLWASLRKTLYMGDEKMKPLPSILGLPDDELQEVYNFLKTYYLRKEDETNIPLRIIKSSTELVLFQTLAEHFGDEFVYYPLPRGDIYHMRPVGEYERKKTVSIINTAPEFVYDFETVNGSFVAGNIEVSNTDSVFVVGDVTYTDKELSEMLDLEVETEGFFKLLVQHRQKNYIKITDKKTVVMGMIGKKKNVPRIIRKAFKEAVEGIEPDFTVEDISRQIYNTLVKYEKKIRKRDMTMEDIMITQSLSKDLALYKSETPLVQAVRNKRFNLKNKGDSRYKTYGEKGTIVDYIRTHTERRWVPVELTTIDNADVGYYLDRLHGVFYQLVNPLHKTIQELKDEYEIKSLDNFF